MERNRGNFNKNAGFSQRFSQGNSLTLEERILVEKQQEMLRSMSLNQGVSPFSIQAQSLTSPFNSVQSLLPALGNVLPSAAALLPNLLSTNKVLPTPAPLLSSSGLANVSAGPQSSLLGPGPPRNSLYDEVEPPFRSKNQDYRRNLSNSGLNNDFERSSHSLLDRPNLGEKGSLTLKAWEKGMDPSGRPGDFGRTIRESDNRSMPSKGWGNKSAGSFESDQVYKNARWGNEGNQESDARNNRQAGFLRNEMQSSNKRGGNWDNRQRDSANLRRDQPDDPRSESNYENYRKKPKLSGDGRPYTQADREALWTGRAKQSVENREGSRYSDPDKWSNASREGEPHWSNKPYSVNEGNKSNESRPCEEIWANKRFPNNEVRNSASIKPLYPDESELNSNRLSISDNSQVRNQNYFKRDSSTSFSKMSDQEKRSLPFTERGFRSGERNENFSRGAKEPERRLNDISKTQMQPGKEFWPSRQDQVHNIKPLIPPSNFLYPDPGKKSSSDVWSRLDPGDERPDNLSALRSNERVAVEDILLTPENAFGWDDGWEGLKSLPVAARLEEPNLQLQMGYLETQLNQLDSRILHIDNFTGINNANVPAQVSIWENQSSWTSPVENLNQSSNDERDLRILLKNKSKIVQKQEPKENDLGSWNENMVVVYPFIKTNKLSRGDIIDLRQSLSDRIHTLIDQNPDNVQPRFFGSGKVCNNWFMVHCAGKESVDWLLTWKPKLKSRPALNLCVRRGVDCSRVTHISIFLKGIQETVRDIELRLNRQNQHLEPSMWRRGPHSSSINGLSVSYFVDAACVKLLEESSWKVYYELTKFKVNIIEQKPVIPLVYAKF